MWVGRGNLVNHPIHDALQVGVDLKIAGHIRLRVISWRWTPGSSNRDCPGMTGTAKNVRQTDKRTVVLVRRRPLTQNVVADP